MVLITTLENVPWLGNAAGWKEDRFSGADRVLSVLTPSHFIVTHKHWWVMVTAWSWHQVFNKGTN